MEWFSRWTTSIAGWLVQAGVAEKWSESLSLALLAVAGLLLLLVIGWLVVRGRKKTVPVGELQEPASAETPEQADQLGAEEAIPSFPDSVAEPAEQTIEAEPERDSKPVSEVAVEAEEPAAPPSERAEPEPLSPEQIRPIAEDVPPVVVPPKPTREEQEIPGEADKTLGIGLFDRMRAGLAKTQASLMGRIDALLSSSRDIDDELLEELEEILVTADFGMQTTMNLMATLEKRVAASEATDPQGLRELLKDEIRRRLRSEAAPFDLEQAKPFVIMVVGVNGVGKTTTIGKMAYQFASQGKKVILGAGDTFRAAAAEQLVVWGERAGVEVIRQESGSDPAAVAYDAIRAAIARKAEILILDTAGRLHTKANLMEELKKVRRVLDRELPGAPHETLLVVDATTGQNALVQARLFREAVAVSGLALTKLDGTARGGMLVAIGDELELPVRYVGIGEGLDDLRPFDPDLFVEALFEKQG